MNAANAPPSISQAARLSEFGETAPGVLIAGKVPACLGSAQRPILRRCIVPQSPRRRRCRNFTARRSTEPEEDPFARDGDDKLIRRGYWLGLSDRSLVQLMTQGIGTRLTPDQKRAHLEDIGRAHLIERVLAPEILPPERGV